MSDEFDALVEGLDLEDPGVADFSAFDKITLMREFHQVKNDLNARGVLVHPETDEDIDRQAYYFGLSQEMRKRGLL